MIRLHRMQRTRVRGAAESGFTLVELLIYVSLFVVVLAVSGGLLINSLRGERIVRSVTAATNLGQLVAQSVQKGVRNAAAVQLTAPVAGTQLLIARTAGFAATPVWACQAWYYSPDNGGSVYTKRASPAALIPAPTSTTPAGWTLIGSGIQPRGDAVFVAPLGRVDLAFTVSAGDSPSVLISTSAYQRQAGSGSAPCF